MTTTLDAARAYIDDGVAVIPVPYGNKAPTCPGWERLRLTEAELPRHFDGAPQNIGILAGEPSGGLADADLDVPEALALAHWLPETGRISGRRSNPGSHRWYRSAGLETTRYKAPDGTTLAELRWTGTQSLAPPSVHPEGEPYVWERGGEAARVDAATLREAMARLAAGALVARCWPGKGSRHEAALALAGVLLRAGWAEDEVRTFVRDTACAAGDEEWTDRGANVRTTARRLAGGGRATGLPTLAALLTDGERVVERLRDWLHLPVAADGTRFTMRGAAASMSVGDAAWPAPLADLAFHGLAGDVVRALEPHTEADPAALLVNALVMFGSAAGRRPHTMVGDTRHGVNLYAALVGATAKGRKGTSESGPRRLVSTADPAWAVRVMSGSSSGEGWIHNVRDPLTKEEAVREQGRGKGALLGYETVVVDPGVADKRLLVSEPELAAMLRVMARDGNTLSPVSRQAWDGEDLRILTKNSPETATAPHISFLGHVTRDELLRYLDATESANGYANRFLWVCVKRSKVLPEGGRADQPSLDALAARLAEALAFAGGCGEVRRDAEARDLWAEVYPDLSEGKPGLFGAVTARSEAQVLRLSLLYAVLDCAPTIRAEHLLAALAVWDYCEASARHIFGDATGDPIADRILRELRTVGPLAQSAIVDLFGRHARAGAIDRALDLLMAAGLVASEKQETGGRPRTVWRVL